MKTVICGKPKKINEESPQAANIILMNFNASYKTIGQSVSDGVFDVNYLRSVAFAYVDNKQGVFIDIANGGFNGISSALDLLNDNNFELCTEHNSW